MSANDPFSRDSATTAPTGVRLPNEVRTALLREASINGRTLSAEITARLIASLDEGTSRVSSVVAQEAASYLADKNSMSPEQRLLLRLFNRLAPAQRLALLTLLGGG